MKIAFKDQATQKKNSNMCSVTEYPLNDSMLDIAIATIAGRYKVAGLLIENAKSLLMCSVVKEKLMINGEIISLAEGDSIIIDAGEPYYWEGNMQLLLSCRPAWTVAQHQQID